MNVVKFLISGASTVFVYLLGGLDIALDSFLIVIILDYITGILAAIKNKNLDSKIGLDGIIKKLCYLVIITLSVVMDKITGNSGVIRTVVIYFFIANDGISIIENVSKMGIQIPSKLKECFKQLKTKED